MALLETLQRKIDKMGLIPRLVKSLPKVSFLLALSGLIWLFTLPLDGSYRGTYISENALMPSQAYSFFRESEWNFVRGYREEIINNLHKPIEEKHAMISSWLENVGYKTSQFRCPVPFAVEGQEAVQLVTYGIYHVPKGDDTEAMVLVAPWKTIEGEDNVGGIALAVGLARYFNRMSIWSKNIIIVFPENGQDALRSWVDAYHSNLEKTGGSIESAVILENPNHFDGIDYVEISYAGVNGQLPNLDLINCAVMISEHEGFKVSLHNTPKGQLWADDYSSRLTTLLKGIYGLATSGLLRGESEGGGNGCEAFSGWNVQTFTIIARGSEGRDITTLGRVVEAVFRSVNNLLEKFHQSFFFYLLLAPRKFVSIGNYLPSGVLTAAAFLVASVSALLTNNNTNNRSIVFNSKSVKLDTIALIYGLLAFTLILFGCILFGVGMMHVATNIIPFTDIHLEFYFGITYQTICLSSFLVSLPLVLYGLDLVHLEGSVKIAHFVRTLNGFSLFYFAFCLIALLVLHFSLSFLISIVSLPLTFVKYGAPNDTRMNALWLLLSSPFVWLLIVGLCNKLEFQLDVLRNMIQYFDIDLVIKEFRDRILTINWTDKEIWMGPVEIYYGLLTGYSRLQNWTWLFVTFAWLPVWVSQLVVSCIDVKVSDKVEDTEKKDV